MKVFLAKLGLNALLAVAGITAVALIYRTWLARAKELAVSLDPEVTIIALGDSHAQCSIDDRDIPYLRNLGDSAESVFLSYWKLRAILEANPGQLGTVMLFVSPHSITERIRRRWHAQPEFFEAKLTTLNLASLMPPAARREFGLGWRGLCYLRLKCDIGIPVGVWSAFRFGMGGFNPSFAGRAVDVSPGPEAVQSRSAPSSPKLSPLLIQHIRHAVALCRKHGAKVLLVNSPDMGQHGDASAQSPGLHAYADLMAELSQYPEVGFLDYGDMPLGSECFRDGSHLNPKGAAVFTECLLGHMERFNSVAPRAMASPSSVRRAADYLPGPRTYAYASALCLLLCIFSSAAFGRPHGGGRDSQGLQSPPSGPRLHPSA